jgi:hypothetical protein
MVNQGLSNADLLSGLIQLSGSQKDKMHLGLAHVESPSA